MKRTVFFEILSDLYENKYLTTLKYKRRRDNKSKNDIGTASINTLLYLIIKWEIGFEAKSRFFIF